MSKQPEAIPAVKHVRHTPDGSHARPFDGHFKYHTKTRRCQGFFGSFLNRKSKPQKPGFFLVEILLGQLFSSASFTSLSIKSSGVEKPI
jgi:hypothetical protein